MFRLWVMIIAYVLVSCRGANAEILIWKYNIIFTHNNYVTCWKINIHVAFSGKMQKSTHPQRWLQQFNRWRNRQDWAQFGVHYDTGRLRVAIDTFDLYGSHQLGWCHPEEFFPRSKSTKHTSKTHRFTKIFIPENKFKRQQSDPDNWIGELEQGFDQNENHETWVGWNESELQCKNFHPSDYLIKSNIMKLQECQIVSSDFLVPIIRSVPISGPNQLHGTSEKNQRDLRGQQVHFRANLRRSDDDLPPNLPQSFAELRAGRNRNPRRPNRNEDFHPHQIPAPVAHRLAELPLLDAKPLPGIQSGR